MCSCWLPDCLYFRSSPARTHPSHTEPISWLSHPMSWKRVETCCVSKTGMKTQRESALYHKLRLIRLKIIAFTVTQPSFHPFQSFYPLQTGSSVTERLARVLPVLAAHWFDCLRRTHYYEEAQMLLVTDCFNVLFCLQQWERVNLMN